MRTEDGYIIRKCLNGETAAFGLLVDKYREGIYALAYSKLGNFHDAEDVTQEAFIRAYKKLRTLRRWDNFMAWMYAITANLCKDWVRARSRRPDREHIRDQEGEAVEHSSMSSYRESLVFDSLQEALDMLPETYRQVLQLRYLGGMKVMEIARFLGASPSTIARRIHRAKSQLKEEMLGMMRTNYEQHKLPIGFTFRIVEMVKRIKIQQIPRTAGLPWGLSLAAGVIIAVLSIGSHLNLPELFPPPASPAQNYEAEMPEFGEMPVEMLRMSRMPFPFGRQGNSYGSGFQLPQQQNTVLMAPRGEGGEFPEEPFARLMKGYLGDIALSPDGKILAAAVWSGICLYDGSNLDEIASFGEEPYTGIAFSPDGNTLAVINEENNIHLWDVQEQKQIGILQGHTDEVYPLGFEFSPDGKILASGGVEKTIRLWDVQEQKQVGVLQGHTDGVIAVTFSPDGKTVASGSMDKTVRLWDVQKQKQVGILQGHTDGVYAVAYSPDGKTLASGGVEKTIRLWDVQGQKQIDVLQGHTDEIYSLVFSPDGKTLASGGMDKIVRLWDVQEHKQIGIMEGFTRYSVLSAFSPDGRTLASRDGNNAIRLWDAQAQKQTTAIEGFGEYSFSLAFSPDGKTLASGANAKSAVIRLWDVQKQEQTGSLEGYFQQWMGPVGTVFSPDGKTVASINGKEIYLFDVQEQKHVGTLKGHTDNSYGISSIAFTPDGKILASAGNVDHTVRLWDVAEQKEIGILRNNSWTHCLSISPDGETLAVSVGAEHLVRLWNIPTQKEIGVLQDTCNAWFVAISPDGKTVASCNQCGQILLWDMETRKQIGVLQGHSQAAQVTFSPDGKWLASVGNINNSADKAGRIWDVQKQEQIFEIQGHSKVTSIVFSPDGKWMATAGDEGAILLWEVNLKVPGWSVEPMGKLPGTWGGMKKTELLQNYPNPFNPETWIPYSLSNPENVTIKIYSATGQLVRTLDLGQRASGEYLSRDKAAHWDGRNEAGEAVASNIYFCVMEAGEFTDSRKIVVAR